LHHGSGQAPGHYGVTSAIWDRVFSTGDARG
jgi:sterol desaturase/sphingolipid hydroxylase (fatty acid hydroxylase superfamily)